MADTDVRHAQNDIAPPSGISYKDKLLQPSDRDELSVPDQPEKPKLPPTKDEGSPPMTVPTGGLTKLLLLWFGPFACVGELMLFTSPANDVSGAAQRTCVCSNQIDEE